MDYNYLTVLTTNTKCNKVVSLDENDEILKKSHGAGAQQVAETVYVGDVQDMEALLREVADDECKCLMQGFFPGTEPDGDAAYGEPFQILSVKAIERAIGDRYAGGWVDVNGQRTIARKKENVTPSSWIQLDRDNAPGLPDALAGLSDDDWLARIDDICEGVSSAGYVRVASSSGRVHLDGKPIDSSGCRYWMQITDPEDYGPFGKRLKLAAMASGSGFMKAIKGGRAVAWTIFDPTVFSWERVVYDGKPAVSNRGRAKGRLSVAEPDIRAQDGGLVNTAKCWSLTTEEADRIFSEFRVKDGGGGGDTTISDGYLELSTAVMTEEGSMTPMTFYNSAHDKLRCEATFRESDTQNGILCRDNEGFPQLFDNGMRTMYTMSSDGRQALEMQQQQALAGVAESPVTEQVTQRMTEDSVAMVLSQELRGTHLFAMGAGRWHYWDGQRWVPHAAVLLHEVRGLIRKYNTKRKVAAEKRNFYGNVVKLLESDPFMYAPFEDFDADNYLLGTPGGVVDLRSGRLRPAKASDMISMQTRVVPQEGGGERFKRFLLEVCDDDAELARFMQVALGACLSGAVEEHWIMFWIGQGRNGKNTLGDLVNWILGDYAGTMPSTALMSSKHQEHATEIMVMKGKRLVSSSEIEDGAFWNESRLNQVTGDDVLTGRYMRQDFVSFNRTHKHLIYGNHRPQLKNITPALAARVKVVPFKVSFLGREDPGLAEALRLEAGFVLSWLVEGHIAWVANGRKLPICAAVANETEEYFSAQSTVDAWIEECCHIDDPQVNTNRKSLYDSYSDWKRQRGEYAPGATRFYESIRPRFLEVKVRGYYMFKGIGLGEGELPAEVTKLIKK